MEEEEHDFSSLNKYFKDEDLIDKTESVKVVKTIIEDISVVESSFGDYESEEEIETQDIDCNIKENSSKVSLERKKFLEDLGGESLTLDTCRNVNKDWNRK